MASRSSRGTGGLADVSARANAVLAHVLKEEAEEVADSHAVSVADALAERPVIDLSSGRTKSRVLFVTTNEAALTPGTARSEWYAMLAPWFDEVHIMVLLPRAGTDVETRVHDNVWTYQVHEPNPDQLVAAALDTAERHLVFNDLVRPDVVVGVDVGVAGWAAYQIASAVQRPFQLHVQTDLTNPDRELTSRRERRQARQLLKRASSVRVATEQLRHYLEDTYTNLTDVAVLPQYYGFTGFRDATPAFDVHERYPGYALWLLATGPLTADSHLHETFTAVHAALLNQRIGLIVLGDGPALSLFRDKARLLGIEEHVIFTHDEDNLISYMKTADLLVCTDTSPDSEVTVLRAASAGLPMALYETNLRTDLFKDGVSALLSPAGNSLDLSKKIGTFINMSTLRRQLSTNSQAVAAARIHEDVSQYQQAVRDTIESVILFPDSTEANEPLTDSVGQG
jgi:glycosyltransferase involved in cell wall biosynthesis